MSYFKHAQHALVNDHVGPTHAFGHAGIEVGPGHHHDHTVTSTHHAENDVALDWMFRVHSMHAAAAHLRDLEQKGKKAINVHDISPFDHPEIVALQREQLLDPMPYQTHRHWLLHHNYDN